jgi:hypothetical protein
VTAIPFTQNTRTLLERLQADHPEEVKRALGELTRLEQLVRAVRWHAASYDPRGGVAHCPCPGPQACVLELAQVAEAIVDFAGVATLKRWRAPVRTGHSRRAS